MEEAQVVRDSGSTGTGTGPPERDGGLLARVLAPSPDPTRVDPGLAAGLRAWLEDGVAQGGLGAPPAPRRPGRLSMAQIERSLVRTVFRLVVCGAAPVRPFEDALSALCVDPRATEVLASVERLGRSERARLRARCAAKARTITADWSRIEGSLLPRTAERIRVPLGGGRVALSAWADLLVGAPSDGTPTVCALRVHPEIEDARHAQGRRHLALVETLRAGAPPRRVASYHVATGTLVCDDVDETMLAKAVVETLHSPAGPASLDAHAEVVSRGHLPHAGARAA